MPSYYDTIDGSRSHTTSDISADLLQSMMIDDQHRLRVVYNYLGLVNNDSGYVMLRIYK